MTERNGAEPTANHSDIAVRLEHVSKAFGSRHVLDDVSFQVAAGEGFCLLGRSGMGKSVTLKIMIGLIKPEAGKSSFAEPRLSRSVWRSCHHVGLAAVEVNVAPH